MSLVVLIDFKMNNFGSSLVCLVLKYICRSTQMIIKLISSSVFVGETKPLCPRKLMCPPVQWVKAHAPVRASTPKSYCA